MHKIVILAESGADIPKELAARHGIHIVPMHVIFGNDIRDDGSFPPEEICQYYERTGKLPTTSCVTPEEFRRAFEDIHIQEPGAHILHLAYSAATTASYQNAQIAAEGLDYVTSVDTKFASGGQCAVVLGVAQFLENHPDCAMADAIRAAESLICRCRMCFIPNDLEYPRAGGRVSNVLAMGGKVLGIHPLIEMLDGWLRVTKKPRGKMAKLVPELVRDYTLSNQLNREKVWLMRSPGLPNDIANAAEETVRSLGFQKIHWLQTGGVITLHGGPSAFGMVGFSEENA